MGTRGLTGFIANQTDLLSYQQYDSYPSGAGVHFLAFLASQPDLDALKALVTALVPVDEEENPTIEQIEQLGGRYHQQVSTGSDWYAHLRLTQGDWALKLESGFLAVAGGVREPDSWVEYSYVADLDAGVLRVYDGNLLSIRRGEWPLTALPTPEQLIAAFA